MRAALVLLLTSSCVPLTLAHEAVVDFEKFRSVRVDAIEGFSWGAGYLEDELERVSGFRSVTTSSTEQVDAVLHVEVSHEESSEEDEDGETVTTYSVKATYRLETSAGEPLHSGEVSDDAEDLREAVEDALDEVANSYIPSYRI